MKAPVANTKQLKAICPDCGNKLYAYWHTPANDKPDLGNWYVECTSDSCKYVYNECFNSEAELANKFNVYQNQIDNNEMVEFILEIDFMTTKEFCTKFKVPHPFWTGNIETSANQFLQIDAIKCKMIIEKAKEINRRKFTTDNEKQSDYRIELHE